VRRLEIISEVRAALAEPRKADRTIGLVPTMGAFHEGHLSLMRRARAECDVVVVSLFVNPTQFNERADLDAYPRDEARDLALAEREGVDLLFVPGAAEIYPPGFATTVTVAGITEPLEGAARGRTHFDGVATVVTKLLNIVGPDVAYFGQKDAQQAQMIRRLVADLDVPTRIEICPTVREPDGLALSSRNVRLAPPERAQASSLHRALEAIVRAARDGETEPGAVRQRGMQELEAAGVVPEYLELVSTKTFTPVEEIDGDALAVVAARVGSTRLIDNEVIDGRT
jgi:pantoate--beta-alanine ligase